MTTFNRTRARWMTWAASLLLATAAPTLSSASATYGTLSNFDVFNDTGEECHGFEIELEDLTSADVVYTFGAPYQRYGNPVVVDYAGGVYVRYLSSYDAGNGVFTATTPMAPAVITPTNGHACWTGGSGNYATSGCEHFGISLRRNPTRTTYRWLVADPANPGSLRPSGTQVSIPAPAWSVQPPPPDAPDQVNPVVVAVIEAPEPPQAFEFGDPLWVKVFVTESPNPADLDHLLSDDPAVPDDETETEVEWQLLQSSKGVPAQIEGAGQVADGDKSVTRRYEFYEYAGPIDPESHEAQPESDSNPLPEEIGNYIGAQMAAVNFGIDVAESTTTTSTTTSTTLLPDADGDTVGDDVDNCFDLANADQADLDGDTFGDVCDDADATLGIRQLSLKTRFGALAGMAKGDLTTVSVDDVVDVSQGFDVEIADADMASVAYTFPSTECTATRGRVRCQSADRSAALTVTPVAKTAGRMMWMLQLKGGAAPAAFAGPASVRISHATAVDRVGEASVCKTSASGASCR